MLFVYFSMVVHLISVILSATLYVGFSAGGYTDLDYSKWSCRKTGGFGSSGRGVQVYKGVGVHLADFFPIFLNIQWKWNNLVSVRPNYFIFIGYLKTRDREGVRANSLWIRHCKRTGVLFHANNRHGPACAFMQSIERLCHSISGKFSPSS